jgi:nucleotide-binding universal stress UspA family protein
MSPPLVRAIMYHDILIPTDGSSGARRAIEEGVGLAGDFGAAVHALYVVDVREYSTLPATRTLRLNEEREAVGERAVEEVVSRAAAEGVPATTAVERGVPHEEILRYADERGVDLVVMGTHARTGLDRFLLGSVTERVVRTADVPVLVVRLVGAGDERERSDAADSGVRD